MARTITPRPINEVELTLRDGRTWRMVCTWGALRRVEQRFGADAYRHSAERGYSLALMAALLYESGVERTLALEEFEELLPSPLEVREAFAAVLDEAGFTEGGAAGPADSPAP